MLNVVRKADHLLVMVRWKRMTQMLSKKRERAGSISERKAESILTKALMTIVVKKLEIRKMPSMVVSLTLLLKSLEKHWILNFEGVEGLKPDPEKHQFHMLVQVLLIRFRYY